MTNEEILEKYHRGNLLIPSGNLVWRSDALKAMDEAIELIKSERDSYYDRLQELRIELLEKDIEVEELKSKVNHFLNLPIVKFLSSEMYSTLNENDLKPKP